MEVNINTKKIIKKRDRNRVLSTIAYVIGFPLMVVLVYLGSIPMIRSDAFGFSAYYGVFAALGVWLVGILFQLLAAAITRNYTGRAVFAIIFTVIVMVGGAVYFDMWAEKKVNAARVEYVRDLYDLDEDEEIDVSDYPEIVIKNYNYQANSYMPWTSESAGGTFGLVKKMDDFAREFERVYCIGYNSTVKGKTNTDGSDYGLAPEGEDGEPEYWFGEKGKVYKENGLYADGYIYGVQVAMEILETYYETQNKYASMKKDADDELEKALQQAAASSEWKNYKNSKEYKDAYGEGGIAESYMLTEKRLDKILSALGAGLVDTGAWGTLEFILDLVVDDFDSLGITASSVRSLSLDSVIELLDSLGIEFTKEEIVSLLEPFSNYEVSNVKPVMYFIKDETLRKYAYAKYFGEVHGTNIGSVLIPSKDVDENGQTVYGNIGNITLSGSGLNYEENAITLAEIIEMKAYNRYAQTLFPLFAARRYVYIFAGIVAICLAIFYYGKMKAKFLQLKLEQMCNVGGR